MSDRMGGARSACVEIKFQPLEIYTKGAYSLEPDLYVERRAAVTALAPLARTTAAAARTARTAATSLARQPPPHF